MLCPYSTTMRPAAWSVSKEQYFSISGACGDNSMVSLSDKSGSQAGTIKLSEIRDL